MRNIHLSQPASNNLEDDRNHELKKDKNPNLEISELRAQVKALEEQLLEQKNKYLYLYSDFETFKRRVVRERSELIRFGWEPLAQEFLLLIDNLERALA